MAYFEQFKQLDGTTLYSGTIATTGPGSSINVQYYQSVSIQVAGSGYINATIEGSNDGTNWNTILVNPSNDLSPVDVISTVGVYNFKTSSLYIRYNVAEYNGTQTLTIIGRSGVGESGADKLAAAFNPDTPININFGSGVKQDKNGALILSDGVPFTLYGAGSYLISLIGYSSIYIQQNSASITALQTIDGSSFFNTVWFPVNSGGTPPSLNPSAYNILYAAPAIGQYIKVTIAAGSSATTASLILKRDPLPAAIGTNIAQVSGTAPQNASGNPYGTLSVGGANLVATNATSNPIPLGGADFASVTRRVQTDIGGRFLITGASPYFTQPYSQNSAPQVNSALPINAVGALPATFQMTAALNVQDSSQQEGQSQIELLSQVLLELRILNQQIYELPRLIATSNSTSQAYAEPPENFRQEQSIFNQ